MNPRARSGRSIPPPSDPPPHPVLVRAALVLLISIWGTTWAAIRIGLDGIPPFTGVSLRFGIAAAILFALSPVLGVRYLRSRHEPWLWVVNGLLSFSISYGVVYWSEQWVPSGLSAVLFATFPLMVALMAHFMLPGELLSLAGLLGTLVGFGGVAVIFSEDFAVLGGRQVQVAAAVLLLSPLAAAAGNIVVKRWGGGAHPVSMAVVPMAVTGAIMGAVAWGLERGRPVTFDLTSVGALLYLAVLGSAVTFSLYYWLLRHLRATQLALIAYAIPVIAVFIGAVFLDEPVTVRTLAGTGLVVVGVAVATRARRK